MTAIATLTTARRGLGEEAYASRIVATNGLVHDELLREIAAARA